MAQTGPGEGRGFIAGVKRVSYVTTGVAVTRKAPKGVAITTYKHYTTSIAGFVAAGFVRRDAYWLSLE